MIVNTDCDCVNDNDSDLYEDVVVVVVIGTHQVAGVVEVLCVVVGVVICVRGCPCGPDLQLSDCCLWFIDVGDAAKVVSQMQLFIVSGIALLIVLTYVVVVDWFVLCALMLLLRIWLLSMLMLMLMLLLECLMLLLMLL